MIDKKIGLFGGTFNPIHNGHLNVAEHALNELELDEIWFIPTFITPDKDKPYKISPQQRFKIIKKSIKYNPRLKVKSFETKTQEISYTYKTVDYITKKFNKNKFYWIMGDDSFNTFHNWKNYKKIVSSVEKIVVFNRVGEINSKLANEINPLIMQNDIWKISSTIVRKGFFSKVPDDAKAYISKNYLYLEEIVKDDLSTKRWTHTKSVSIWAKNISEKNSVNPMKSYYAGIIHDMAKEWDKETLIKFISRYSTSDVSKIPEKILHAHAAYYWWIHVYQSKDMKIANSVLKHTTASAKMSKLDKIIYTADKIADNRNYEEVNWIRDIAKVDIDRAFMKLIKIQYEYGKDNIGINNMDRNTILAYKKYGEK